LVEWSLAAFRAVGQVGAVVIACPPGHAHDLDGDDLTLVDGGETRAESVANALNAVETDLVAIHDAARPLVTPELIGGTLDTLLADADAAGAIAATPIVDTIKQVRAAEETGAEGPNAETSGISAKALEEPARANLSAHFPPHRGENAPTVVEATLDRGRLWAAQTPQIFRTEALRRGIGSAENVPAATDEAMLVEAAGGRVLIHPSPPENLKVTTPLDLRLAELLLTDRERAGRRPPATQT
jgi:2-C-methyl-D-erythritol 4-phosphate cytidylyltransferase